ncbi:MAG TPA: cytidine deaminase [Terriglobales bacterium]|nr:cytidine deaminase [Terriglobales bacterium]
MMTDPVKEMIALAQQAMTRSYAPYSHFHVGAVLRGANGKLYVGCNVENAAYPQSQCAEASAIGTMVMDGERKITEVLVMGQGDDLISPCGGCRQRLREFADDGVKVHLCDAHGVKLTTTMGALLPHSFGPDHLKK